MSPDLEESFASHLYVLKNNSSITKSILNEVNRREFKESLDGQALAQQQSFFKLTMKHNTPKAMAGPFVVNPMTKLWEKVATNLLLCSRISEWFKLVELANVTVIGSVEDKHKFNTLSWMKNRTRNS